MFAIVLCYTVVMLPCARLLIALLLAWLHAVDSAAQTTAIPTGAARFSVSAAAPDGSPLTVWTYRPDLLRADDPIVIVMHGVLRNARVYRDNWAELARVHRLLVLVPEMTQRQFPGNAGYSLGNMVDRKGQAQPAERWAWSVIEAVFDAARVAVGSTRQTYVLFGHSAGAQFVHRLAMFADNPRFEVAISANAGWYTMPTLGQRFPYGLRGAPADPAAVRAAFARRLVVLLGDKDTDPADGNLRRTPAAARQGANRLERGQRFFETAEAAAKLAGGGFAWRLEMVPGVDHDNDAMARAAIEWVLGRKN